MSTATPTADKAAILAALEVMFDRSDVVELRTIFDKGRKRIDSGYFDSDHWQQLADCAAAANSGGAAVYVTLNPVDPQLLARYNNRVQSYASATTVAKQIVRRRWLFIDLDPVRPAKIGSSPAQFAAAQAKAQAIFVHLQSIGWPAPVVACSGNGFHLLYAVDLPNDDASTALIKGVLLALAGQFDDEVVQVDQEVFDASRICKLYGTVANKGDHIDAAPWRLSVIESAPARVLVTPDQLRQLQPVAPEAAPRQPTRNAQPGRFNLEVFLSRHGLEYTSDRHEGSERFKLKNCPFNPEHVNGEAAVFRDGAGKLGFDCKHNSCSGHTWKSLRELLDGPAPQRDSQYRDHGARNTSSGAADTAPLSEAQAADLALIRSAAMVIPATAALGGDTPEKPPLSASKVIGYALSTEYGKSHRATALKLATEWDAKSGGSAAAEFEKADPDFPGKPITKASLFRLAREHGWTEPEKAWSEPQPLIAKTDPQEYPVDALPDLVRCAVQEVAGFVRAPLPLVAASALSALSLAIQAHADVARAERLTGPCSLFMLSIADSGERKSTSDSYFMPAIRDYETRQHEAAKPLLKAYKSEMDAWEAQRSGIKEKIKSLARDGKPCTKETAQLHELDEAEPVAPRVPRLIYSDATPEALTFALAKKWPSGGVISSEAGGVFGGHGMGADSVMRNLATLNSLWDGATLSTDRRTTESFVVRGARLTMGLQVQADTLQKFFSNTKGLARGTGFLARFLVSWPQTTMGTRFYKEPAANWPALAAFNARLTAILDRPAPIADDGVLTPAMLTLSPEAKAVWIAFHDAVEIELPSGRELCDVRDVASKIADNAVRLAALFHTFAGSVGPIDVDTMESAARIVTWHLSESKRFLGELALPAELANPVRLDHWLIEYCRREGTDRIATRQIQQFGPGPVREKEALNSAISELVDHGRAKLVMEGKKRLILVNPALLTEAA